MNWLLLPMAIRVCLTVGMLVQVYKETGGWTASSIGLLWLGFEFQVFGRELMINAQKQATSKSSQDHNAP